MSSTPQPVPSLEPRATAPVAREYVWLLFVTFLFGIANSISYGNWDATAIALLTFTLVVLVWRYVRARDGIAPRLVGEKIRTTSAWLEPDLALRMVFALLASLSVKGLLQPAIVAQPSGSIVALDGVHVAALLLVASYLPFLDGRRVESARFRTARFILFAILLVMAGIDIIRVVTPSPGIDVFAIQTRGAEVLLHGKNPYTWASVPDTDPETNFTVPYVYPPTVLYAGTLAVLVAGDVRYVLLLAVVVTGFALRFIARRGGEVGQPALLEDAPALFLWQTPMVFMVLELSWVDPLQLMLVSVAVAAIIAEKKTVAAIVFGVAVSSKQSMFWLFPLAGVVLRFDVRRWLIMSAAALVPAIPFIVWDFRALKYANLEFMAGLPPRRDALCFTNAMLRFFDQTFPPATGFVLAAITTGAALAARKRRSVSDFSVVVVLTFFVFFFFNRWAFANYYFLLTGLAALAAATTLRDRPS